MKQHFNLCKVDACYEAAIPCGDGYCTEHYHWHGAHAIEYRIRVATAFEKDVLDKLLKRGIYKPDRLLKGGLYK